MVVNPLHVVWFKRDLRIVDHAPLAAACAAGPVLPIFIWAPQVWTASDASRSQAEFVRECLQSLRAGLSEIGLYLHIYQGEPLRLLQQLQKKYGVAGLYSHEETGNDATYRIDQSVLHWCQSQSVPWFEWPQNGVVRRLRNRGEWQSHWEQRMEKPCLGLPKSATGVRIPDHGDVLPAVAGQDKALRQRGGIHIAHHVLDDFLSRRVKHYQRGISNPTQAVSSCSRLSPYLAWGVLSYRSVVQSTRLNSAQVSDTNLKKNLHSFESRLHWHCHFMQKLESEPRIEFESFYSGFDQLFSKVSESAQNLKLTAWQSGETGWPLIDACMRMLYETGWLNFRMRAMLMSTASYLMGLPWRQTGLHLAREFVDYEPGIHWPQVQMQSGTTGINALRIYHPVKQAIAQDPQGQFVRRWIPALARVPQSWIFEPWRMPVHLQYQYGCIIGRDYPAPSVNIEDAMRLAKQRWGEVRLELRQHGMALAIIERHASRKSSFFPHVSRNLSGKTVRQSPQLNQMILPF